MCDLCLDWNFADCDNCDLKREAAGVIQQDNIKNFAIAAFRYRGHISNNETLTADDTMVLLAVASALHHLDVEHDYIAVEGVKQVYYKLPMGNIKRGVLSKRVKRAAYDMHIDESTLWRKLHRARTVFERYYEKFTSKNCQ